MDVSVENTSTLGRRLKISVPDATIEDKIKVKMAKLGKSAHLKGFRRGKVPKKVLEREFGASVRYEVIEDVIRQSLGEAVQKNALQPAGVPTIEAIKNESGEPLEFTAAFEIFPEITLQDISALTVEKKVVTITDTDVTDTIERLRDQFSDWETKEGPIQSGDRITVDFSRLLKEVGAEKETQNNVKMVVGSKGVLPGLTEALLARGVGDTVEGEFQYPETWPEEAVKGKAVTLWITIHTIEEKNPLTQEALVNKLGATELSEEDFLARVRENMEKELAVALRDELRETVLDKLLTQNIFDVPNSLVLKEADAIRQEAKANRLEPGSEDEIAVEAKQRVHLGLLLNEIVQKYDLKATTEQMHAEIRELMSQFPDPSKVAPMLLKNREFLSRIERKILLDASVDTILKEAKVTEKTVTYAEMIHPGREA